MSESKEEEETDEKDQAGKGQAQERAAPDPDERATADPIIIMMEERQQAPDEGLAGLLAMKSSAHSNLVAETSQPPSARNDQGPRGPDGSSR